MDGMLRRFLSDESQYELKHIFFTFSFFLSNDRMDDDESDTCYMHVTSQFVYHHSLEKVLNEKLEDKFSVYRKFLIHLYDHYCEGFYVIYNFKNTI